MRVPGIQPNSSSAPLAEMYFPGTRIMGYISLSTDPTAVAPMAPAGVDEEKGPLVPLFPADTVHETPAATIRDTRTSSASASH